MARPRIEGMDERIVASFIDRKIYQNQKEVISAALKALVREQKIKEAHQRSEQQYDDDTYLTQLDNEKESNASVGNLVRTPAVRKKRVESSSTK